MDNLSIWSKRLKEGIDRQMGVYADFEMEEEKSFDNDCHRGLDTPTFPDRKGEPVVRRRTRAQSHHLIELMDHLSPILMENADKDVVKIKRK